MVVLSPSIWVKSLGNAHALFPYDHPALFSMPLTFILIYAISKCDQSPREQIDKAGFGAQDFRTQSGVEISGASQH